MNSATFQIVKIDTLLSIPVSFPEHVCYYTLDTKKYYVIVNTVLREVMFDVASILGETSTTAYRGDRGKIAYDHSQITGNPHGTTKANVGLGNVPNIDATNPANIIQTSSYRFTTDAEKSSWNGKEPAITIGTTSQYFRGDKTFQTLDKTAVGLGNVDNTSDLNKPISNATQTALNSKADLVGGVIPSAQIPSTAISEFCGAVLNQSAMLSPSLVTLAGNVPSTGDWCIRSDEQYGYVLVATPHTTLGNWQKIVTPASPVQSVNGQIGIVTLGKSDIGLGNVPNIDATNPANISQNSSYRFITDAQNSVWSGKQDALVSGTNIKTINGVSLLGSGDIDTSLSIATKVYIDSVSGINATGRGSLGKPYLTPEYALSDITNTSTFVGNITSGSTTISGIASTTNISIGDYIYAAGVSSYDLRVVAKTSTTLTLSSAATSTTSSLTITYYKPYTLVLTGNFTATGNWHKLGFFFDCTSSYISWGAFTLFDITIEGYVPVIIKGGSWTGTTATSKFLRSYQSNVCPDIHINCEYIESKTTGYVIESSRSTGRYAYITINVPKFIATSGTASAITDVQSTIWTGYVYGLLSGLVFQSLNTVFTGVIETPVSVQALYLGNGHCVINATIYGGLQVISADGVFNGNVTGVTNQVSGASYNSGFVVNGSFTQTSSGALTIAGCNAIINGEVVNNVTHNSGNLFIRALSGNYTSGSSNNPVCIVGYAGQTFSSIVGNGANGIANISVNGNARLILENGAVQCPISVGANAKLTLKRGMYLYISGLGLIAGTLINEGYVMQYNNNSANPVTGKIVNKGYWGMYRAGQAENSTYTACLVVSTGTIILDGGQMECTEVASKSGIIRKTSTGTIVLKGQPSLKVANGLSPIQILGSALNGNIKNYGCITNCPNGFGILDTFSDTTYGTAYAVNDLVGGINYEDSTNNTFNISD